MAQKAAPLSVLVVTDSLAQDQTDAHAISAALTGYLMLGVRVGDATLPEAVAHLRPDVIVIRADSGVRDVLEHIVMATRDARRPIAMFTDDASRSVMREALGAGVSAYVVAGLKAERVQAVIDVALERFAVDEALRAELTEAKSELADRKLIDRAKKLLMQKRNMSEPDAHRFMQTTAMEKGLKVRDVAERIVDLASLLG
jgi:two-component system, response regulator / RNA-binding antiterminator